MCLFRLVLLAAWLVPMAAALGSPDQPDPSPTFNIAPAPSWVKPLDPDAVPVPKSTEVEDGVDYLLIDRQQLMEPMASFSHFTRRLINEHGLQNGSEIRGEYDPSYQSFTMHWLKIKRDGIWQDRLPTEKFQVLRREENLDSQLLDGRFSVVCHLQDVRIGDEIDFAYTVTGANPVFNGKFLFSFGTTWSNPVHLLSNQLITAPNRTVSFKSYGSPLEPTRTQAPDQSQLFVWKSEEVPAAFGDDDTPDWYDTYGWVQISEFSSWKEVVDWGLATYPFDAPLSPEMQNKIAAIANAHTGAEARALDVLGLVQNDIRYLGIEMGANSYKPTPSSLVYEHRFGDCKDKTLLCVVMLRALGIEAYPALVNTDYRQNTANLLPSPLAFDHAIVQLIIDNRTYWIDPTRSGQRGRLRDFYVDDYKQALVLKAGVDALVPMEVSPESLPQENIQDTFTVKSVQAPVLFQVHSIYKGLSADSTRSSFGESSIEKIEKDYLDYYARHYPKIKMGKPLHYQDFPDENRFEVWEEYAIPDLWTRETPASKWKAVFSPYSISDDIGSPPSPQRASPYHLNYPTDISENLEIRMFDNWNVDSKPNEVATPYFTFSDNPSVDKNIVSFKYHFKTLTADVLPANMADYHDQVKKIQDNLAYNLTYLPTSEVPATPEPFRPNWMAFTISALIFGLSCYIAYRVYAGQRPHPPLPPPFGLTEYEGLRGWLILIMLGLVLRAILYAKAIVIDHAVTWNATKWNTLTVPGASSYDPLWAPTLLVELSFAIVFFVLSILAFILMLQKRFIFPKVMISFFVLILIFKFIDVAMVNQIPFMVKEQNGKFDDDLVRVIVQAVVWIPYFVVSKRVKATFRF